MNTTISTIITNLQSILEGHPWYGRAVYEILDEAGNAAVYYRPNKNIHSLIDLLYHMVMWAEFTQKRIEKEPIEDMRSLELMNWRPIDPAVHDWQKGLTALKAAHNKIIALLRAKDDMFLQEKVDYREYNFNYLLNGLIQHNIYHLGQIACLSKLQDV